MIEGMKTPPTLHSARKQGGFTLIELGIVIVVIGLLSVLVARSIGGGMGESARAQAIWSATGSMTDNWEIVANYCGTSFDPDQSEVVDHHGGAGATVDFLGFMATGTSEWAGDQDDREYRCYRNSGVSAMDSIEDMGGGAWGIADREVSSVTYDSNTREMIYEFPDMTTGDADALEERYGEGRIDGDGGGAPVEISRSL